MLDELFESLDIPIASSRRAQTLFRVLFGLVGVGLALAGGWIGLARGFGETGWPFRLAGVSVFVAMGCFCMFSVTLHRPWRWPGRAFIASLIGLFVVRVVFGA